MSVVSISRASQKGLPNIAVERAIQLRFSKMVSLAVEDSMTLLLDGCPSDGLGKLTLLRAWQVRSQRPAMPRDLFAVRDGCSFMRPRTLQVKTRATRLGTWLRPVSLARVNTTITARSLWDCAVARYVQNVAGVGFLLLQR
jgi:hypothetical protein